MGETRPWPWNSSPEHFVKRSNTTQSPTDRVTSSCLSSASLHARTLGPWGARSPHVSLVLCLLHHAVSGCSPDLSPHLPLLYQHLHVILLLFQDHSHIQLCTQAWETSNECYLFCPLVLSVTWKRLLMRVSLAPLFVCLPRVPLSFNKVGSSPEQDN